MNAREKLNELEFERAEFEREGDGLGLFRALLIWVPILSLFWIAVFASIYAAAGAP
jgi:hypothetical protein